MRARRRVVSFGFLLLAVLLWNRTVPSQASPPDAIFFNGRFITEHTERPSAEAVAIRDGRFVAVGSTSQVRALAGAATRQVDLRGQTVVPGLADNHFHSIGGGPGVDLSRARTIDDVLAAIRTRASSTPAGQVIVSNGDWHEGQLKEQRLPYRSDLDRAAPNHPIVVVRGGHEYILNSAALEKWNITEKTPEPSGGSIGRDKAGRLNGELVDRARSLVTLPSPPSVDREQIIKDLAAEHRRLNEAGLTGIRYAGIAPEMLNVLREMARRRLLTLRVHALLRITSADNLDGQLAPFAAKQDEGDEWLRVGGIKLLVDGGFEGGWMREPYEEPWGKNGTFRGLQTFATEPYTRVVRALNQRGWRVATHAVGDAAIDLVLDAYEAADRDSTIAGKRWSIEHAFLPRPDQFPRMKKLGIVVSAQNHLYLAAPSLKNYWGSSRAARVTPMRAYIDAGIPVSTGTDSAVVPYPPFWTLYHFITRDTISAGVMGPDQRITRDEALRAATLGNAYLTFEERSRGSIQEGKLADFLVLSKDFLTCSEKDIESMTVLTTVVGGKIVFSR
jgi:predicted amidohydrolase YtcJ